MKGLLVILAITFLLGAGRAPTQESPPASGTPAPAASRRPPQARTQQEYNDYNTSYAITGGAPVEKAANDFATKYPTSELRVYLYAKAMHEYQSENNPTKMLAMGEKVLALDADHTIALVLTATVLSDQLSDADLDRAQKIAEIRKNSARALETLDTAFLPPPGATPQQVAGYKSELSSMAHSALGIMELKTGDDRGAEKDLRAAADLSKTQPDPYIWYHLALAQDHQGKYPEALTSVNQALQYTGSNPELGKLAAGEQERLSRLVAPQAQPSPSPPPQ